MTRAVQPSPAEERKWRRWLAKLAPEVRAVGETLDPWTLYRIRPTGQRVTLLSLDEHPVSGAVTITVLVSKQFNGLNFEHRIFNLRREDIEEVPAALALTGNKAVAESIAPDIIRRRNAKEWKR